MHKFTYCYFGTITQFFNLLLTIIKCFVGKWIQQYYYRLFNRKRQKQLSSMRVFVSHSFWLSCMKCLNLFINNISKLFIHIHIEKWFWNFDYTLVFRYDFSNEVFRKHEMFIVSILKGDFSFKNSHKTMYNWHKDISTQTC